MVKTSNLYLMALSFFVLSSFALASPAVPSNIVAYIPITLTNYQNIAVAANTPLAIGTTALGGVIGINALEYNQYYTCSLNNAEFFFANGTVATSWLEGNILSEQYANTICTSASSQNALVDSANILYWVKIPNANFLPANTGTATTNTIYLGWAGNVVSSANTLMNGNTVGEAPQLSCTNPANTILGCNAGQYGQYDNGANTFSLYINFSGVSSSAPSGWSFIEVGGGTLAIDNGIQLYAVSGDSAALYRNLQMYPQGNVIDGFITSVTPSSDELVAWDTAAPTGNNAAGTWWGLPGNAMGAGTGGGNPALIELVYSDSGTAQNVKGANNAAGPYIASASWQSINALATINYTANEYAGAAGPTPGLSYPVVYVNNNQHTNEQWFRVRTEPPNGISPGTTYGTVQLVGPACSASITNPSNSIADAGQYESFTASESSCVNPYTYNILVVNSITTGTITHNDLLTGQTATSVTYTFQTVSADTSNSPEKANVVVTDSGANTVTSAYSTNFIIYSALGTPTVSPSSPSIDSGQSLILTATWSGGAPDYTVKWYTGPPGSTCAQDSANVLATYSSLTGASNSMSVSPITTNSYCAGVTDSANTPVTELSANDVMMVNPALTNSWSASNNLIDQNQYQTLTSNVFGGSNSFTTANFNGANSVVELGEPASLEGIQVPLTITGWFNTKSNTGDQPIYAAYESTSSNQLVSMVRIDSGSFKYYTSTSTGTFQSATYPIQPSLNKWHFFAVVVSGSITSPTVSIYLDNNGVQTTSLNSLSNTPATVPICIGSDAEGGASNCLTSSERFDGNISDLQIYNTALNPSSVNALYTHGLAAQPLPNNGIVSNWMLNGNTDDGQGINNGNTYNIIYITVNNVYTYYYTVYNSLGLINSQVVPLALNSNSLTYLQNPSWGTGVFTANIAVTDEATTPETADNTLTYNTKTALTPPTLTASNTPSVDTGQYELLTASWTGGTSSYTANYQVFNTITGMLVENTFYTGITGTSNTFLWQVPSNLAGNTISANVFITDSASTPVTANSAEISTITISAPVTTTTATTTIPSGGGGSGGVILHNPSTYTTSTTSVTTTTSSTILTTSLTTSTLTTTIASSPPIEIAIKSIGATTSQLCENFNNEGYAINYTSLGAVFEVSLGSSGCFNMTAFNATSSNINASNNLGHILRAINFSLSNSNMSAVAILHYQCSIPSQDVAPFILRNRSWSLITPFAANASTCTVTFAVPQDPVIALFYNTTGITTVQTTVQTTSSNVPVVQQTPNALLTIIVLIIIIAALILLYMLIRKKSWRRRF